MTVGKNAVKVIREMSSILGLLCLLFVSSESLAGTPACDARYLNVGPDQPHQQSQGSLLLKEDVQQKRIDCIKVAFEKGVDPHYRVTPYQMSAADEAARSGNLEILRVFAEHKTDFNRREPKDGFPPLFYAISFKNMDTLNFLLNLGVDPLAKTNSGVTALIYLLSRSEHQDVRKLLQVFIEKGVPINAQTGSVEGETKPFRDFGSGISALILASQNGNLEVVKYLLEKHADVHLKDENGRTALLAALWGSKPDVAKVLIENHASLTDEMINGASALHAAASSGNFEVVKLALAAGAKKDFPIESGETPLSLAAEGNHLEIFKYLAEQGVSLQDKTAEGLDLRMAGLFLDNGNLDALKYLKSKKYIFARPGSKKDNLLTLLRNRTGRRESNIQITKFLVDQGCAVNSDPENRNSPLSVAIKNNDIESVNFLSEHGAVFNEKIFDGTSPLLVGAELSPEMLKFILNHMPKKHVQSVFPEASDADIFMPVLERSGEAFKKESELKLKMLLDAGVSPNAKDRWGETALHLAVRLSQNSIKTLLQKGADPTIKNAKGLTALDMIKVKQLKNFDPLLEEQVSDWRYKKYLDASTSDSLSVEDENDLLRSMVYLFQQKILPAVPPKHASEKIKKVYQNLKTVKTAPYALTAEALDLKDLPLEYYRTVITAARSAESRTAKKFDPSVEQLRSTAEIIFKDPRASLSDYESMSWLLTRGNFELNEKMLELFKFDKDSLRKDVDLMLKYKPFEYKGMSSMASIKLIKALLDYDDEDFTCGQDGEESENSQISNIITWFSAYGDNSDADRLFFSKLARLVLEKKKLCSRDKTLLLRAMRDWRGSNANVQFELACSFAHERNLKPIAERSLNEALELAKGVGLMSELSFPAWIEELKVYHSIGADQPIRKEFEIGLIGFVLGARAGKIELGDKHNIVVQEASAHKGSIAKLCKIISTASTEPSLKAAGESWMKKLKAALDQPRVLPEGFTALGAGDGEASGASLESLRVSFENLKMDEDLRAIETGCSTGSAAGAKKTAESASKPKSVRAVVGPAGEKRAAPKDFSPGKRK